jgi:hypothetical protein
VSDSAGNAEAVTVEASVVETGPQETSDVQRFFGVVLYGIAAIVFYAVIRMLVLAAFAIVWQIMPRGQTGAAVWMLFVEPFGLALGAYLTLLTNQRNRPFHLVLTVIVFASVVLGHITWPVGNPYIPKATDALRITAWFSQAIFVLIGALIGFWRTKPKELKIPKMLLPPKLRELRSGS